MLTKDNNKTLFKSPYVETNKKEKSQNLIDHNDCILQLDKLYEKIKRQDLEIISYKNQNNNLKHDYNNLENKFIESCKNENILYEENKILKNKVDGNNYIYNDMEFGNDIETLLIQENIDIISMKKQIKFYEYQLNCINNIFTKYNVKNEHYLIDILKNYNQNNYKDENLSSTLNYNYNSLLKKYNNIITISNVSDIKIKSQKLETIKITNKFKDLDIRIKKIRNKLNKLPIGTIVKINSVKKIFKGKTEKLVDKINMMEEEYNNYIKSQILWARKIVNNDINDDKLVKILDLYNKLTNNKNISYSSESETETNNKYYNILNENKNIKILEFETYSKLGNQFIDDEINSKKDLSKDSLIFIKEIIKTSDIKSGTKDDKINRFINTCKRYFILSQKLSNKNNIIKNKCKTDIRDINNNDFDILLKLLES